jgi:hypothetical protein
MDKSETIGALAAALAKAQAEMTHARKDAANPFFKSRYADLSSVMEAIRGPLTANGIAVVQSTDTDDSGVIVETVLMHSSGEWISGRLRVRPVKDDPQALGSAITYGRRYGLQSMVSLPADDDDGNAASGNRPQQQQARPTQQERSEATSPPAPRPEPQRIHEAPPQPSNGEPKTEAQRQKLLSLMKALSMSGDAIDRASMQQFGTMSKNLNKEQTAQFILTLEKVQRGEV